MAGSRVELFLPWRQGILLELRRQEAQEATMVKIEVAGAFYPDRIRHLQTIGGLKFQGPVHMDETTTTQASLLVRDDAGQFLAIFLSPPNVASPLLSVLCFLLLHNLGLIVLGDAASRLPMAVLGDATCLFLGSVLAESLFCQ
jgi:hypothetical protein